MLQKNNSGLINENTLRVSRLFFESPNEKFHLRKIALITKLSTTAVNSVCNKLIDLKIIKVSRGALVKEFKADMESTSFYNHKIIFNLYRLKTCGLIEELANKLNPEAIVLFGSYVKGEDIEKSDIDLLIISKRDINVDLSSYEKSLNREIKLYQLKNLNTSEHEFINNISNGVVLYGYLRVV